MWLIIPLVYFLAWWQTGSLRQALNATIAWIIGFLVSAGALLILDYGGSEMVSATPDSPATAIAILGGFIGMWISNILWRRRGGDPPRKHGKWERAVRAMFGGEQQKKKKKRKTPAPQQQVPPPPQQPAGPPPIEAQYRPGPPQQQGAPQYEAQATTGQQQYPPQGPNGQPQAPRPQPQQVQATPRKQKKSQNSPTADKYAKATGRALGAMFRGSSNSKKKPRNSDQR